MAIQEAQWTATRTLQPEAASPEAAGDGTPTSYHIWTIGCQMNKADSDRLASALEQLGLHFMHQECLAQIRLEGFST